MPKSAQSFLSAESVREDMGVDLTVCQCSGCGLVQLNNEPVSYYREVIRASSFSNVLMNIKIKQFEEFIKKYNLLGGKILEVGCGRGEFLSLLRTLEVDAYGLEYSESSVDFCLANGLKVQKGYIDAHTGILANAPFDAFFLLMFLEHMPDPNATLRGIYNNLTDNAVGLIEVPNYDMILRCKLFSEFIADHLFYFSIDSLKIVLNLNGFEIIECNELRDKYVISAVVRKRNKMDISDFSDHQDKITTEINEYIGRFGEKKVAIWGAGHQSLVVIALTKIANRIKFIIDSASFKQGKFSPVTHLPIVSPSALEYEQVEAVIVMAAAYSDEVADILKHDFGQKIKVAILRDFGLEIVM